MTDLQMYSLEWCPYCIKAKALLKAKDIPYRETDVTHDRELALEMIERSGRNSVPQIFLDDELVGGYDELAHLTVHRRARPALRPASRPKLKPVYDVAVIGGGAAGLSAAMYASRKGLSTVLISEDVGGQVGVTRDIFNYPGYDYVTGPGPLGADDRAGRAEPDRAAARRVRRRPEPRGPLQGHRARVGPASVRRFGDHRQRRDQAPPGDPRRGRVRGLRRRLLLHLRRPALQGQDHRRGRRRQLGLRGGARDERHRAQGVPGDARRRSPPTRSCATRSRRPKRVEHLQGQLAGGDPRRRGGRGPHHRRPAQRRAAAAGGRRRVRRGGPAAQHRASRSTSWRPTRPARSSSTRAGAPACAACSPPATAPRCPTSRSWWRPATAPRRRCLRSSTWSASADPLRAASEHRRRLPGAAGGLPKLPGETLSLYLRDRLETGEPRAYLTIRVPDVAFLLLLPATSVT